MPVFWAMYAIRTMGSVGDALRTLDMSAHADVSNGVITQSAQVLSAFATLPFASGNFAVTFFRFGVVPDGTVVVANGYAH